MAFCVDANTFIQAKNTYYGFDFCPAFWSWLDREAEGDQLLCVKSIYDEISEGSDELATWIKNRNKHKWLCRVDGEATQKAMQAVAAYVESRRGHYTDDAISKFMAKADPWLISYSLAHGHTVATHEISQPESRKSVKIPDVCAALGVPCIGPFELLRQLKAHFVLGAGA